jgi:hypothetical protein
MNSRFGGLWADWRLAQNRLVCSAKQVLFDSVEPKVELRLDRSNPGGTRSIVGADCDVTIVVVVAFLVGDDKIFHSVPY